ncbi:MAG: DUF1080 domain-containing protein [Phycisphaerales bacterium]|nr:DUF1080 domain-containing protein [Phycisphaerae bacterium]NNF43817.1 DUF1080 domain-containing protein [Phycisphaerales bacterium]NNM27197.1 DUF1080 domain-containing protein [Phycisphaerales bacterium]
MAAALASDPGPSPTFGATPPTLDDRTEVLFDGSRFAGWHQPNGTPSPWLVRDGVVTVTRGHAITDGEYGDFQLHLEFLCPEMPGRRGQGRANSGVYLHGRYEVQVLDSHGDPPAMNTCGAIYSIAPALVNATRPPGDFQTYDIVFRAPRFDDDGTVTEFARVSVVHNGIVIHNNQELPHTTTAALFDTITPTGPIMLQDHGNPVQYRNIWIRRLD